MRRYVEENSELNIFPKSLNLYFLIRLIDETFLHTEKDGKFLLFTNKFSSSSPFY